MTIHFIALMDDYGTKKYITVRGAKTEKEAEVLGRMHANRNYRRGLKYVRVITPTEQMLQRALKALTAYYEISGNSMVGV